MQQAQQSIKFIKHVKIDLHGYPLNTPPVLNSVYFRGLAFIL